MEATRRRYAGIWGCMGRDNLSCFLDRGVESWGVRCLIIDGTEAKGEMQVQGKKQRATGRFGFGREGICQSMEKGGCVIVF